MNNLFLKIASSFVVCLGVLLVFWGLQIYNDEKNSQYWPSTSGTVIQTELIRSCCRGGVSFTPSWTYEYFIDSKRYTSYRTTFGSADTYSNEVKAQQVLSSHPIGSKVSVIYNPNNHNKAALQLSNSTSFYWLLLFVGLLCIIIGLFILKVVPIHKNENNYV